MIFLALLQNKSSLVLSGVKNFPGGKISTLSFWMADSSYSLGIFMVDSYPIVEKREPKDLVAWSVALV